MKIRKTYKQKPFKRVCVQCGEEKILSGDDGQKLCFTCSTNKKRVIPADIIGKKIRNVTVILASRYEFKRGYFYICRCDCGETIERSRFYLRSSHYTSICYSNKCKFYKNSKSNLSRHPLYLTWHGMIARCYDKTHRSYKNYGERGIKVCDRWLESLENFIEDMHPKKRRSTLDRIDCNGDYSPQNCRWATLKIQNNNRRSTRMIEIFGMRQSAHEWSKFNNVAPYLIIQRIDKLKWPPEQAVTIPKQLSRLRK